MIEELPRVPETYLKSLEETDALFEIRIKQGSDIFRIFRFFDESKLLSGENYDGTKSFRLKSEAIKMTLTIEIAPEIESRLEAEARRSGMSKTDLAKNVIEERFALVGKDERENYPSRKSRYVGKAETRDFSGDREWLRENSEKYQGQYVALHGNRLIASGSGYKEIITKAREAGFPDALLTYIEPFDTPPFAGV